MDNFFAELKRRHIYRVATAYVVAAWIAIQAVNNLAPMLRLPDWVGTFVVVLLLIGFPIALVFAWIGELKTSETGPGATGIFDWALMAALMVGIGTFAYQEFAPSRTLTSQQTSVDAQKAEAKPGISVAVLPFINLSSDKEQEFFSDGMTEEITTALAKVRDLRVVGRTSAFQFKGQNLDLRDIGQKLSATHLIEGSVRKAGDRVRVTVQLIKSDDGTHIWAEDYDRQLTDIFAIQEDIARAITTSLKAPLGLQPGENLVNNRTNNVEAYQEYLRARNLARARAPDALAAAERVVARDPTFAPARALLALVYLLPGSSPLPQLFSSAAPQETRRAAQSLYERVEHAAADAIRLDPKHSGGYAARAQAEALAGKWVEADEAFQQALALDPNDPDILDRYAVTLGTVGRFKEALRLGDLLRTLEPFVPIYRGNFAIIAQLSGDSSAAIPIFETMPTDGVAGLNRAAGLAVAYAAQGRYADAADMLLAIPGNQNIVSRRAVEDAARLLRSAPVQDLKPETLPSLGMHLDFVYAYIGAPDRAFETWESAVFADYFQPAAFARIWYPFYGPLRKTDRFKKLVRDAGLVNYWRAKGWPDLCHAVGTDDFACE